MEAEEEGTPVCHEAISGEAEAGKVQARKLLIALCQNGTGIDLDNSLATCNIYVNFWWFREFPSQTWASKHQVSCFWRSPKIG